MVGAKALGVIAYLHEEVEAYRELSERVEMWEGGKAMEKGKVRREGGRGL